jgi:hypothetical protein
MLIFNEKLMDGTNAEMIHLDSAIDMQQLVARLV